jgi:hypothetical protein
MRKHLNHFFFSLFSPFLTFLENKLVDIHHQFQWDERECNIAPEKKNLSYVNLKTKNTLKIKWTDFSCVAFVAFSISFKRNKRKRKISMQGKFKYQ